MVFWLYILLQYIVLRRECILYIFVCCLNDECTVKAFKLHYSCLLWKRTHIVFVWVCVFVCVWRRGGGCLAGTCVQLLSSPSWKLCKCRTEVVHRLQTDRDEWAECKATLEQSLDTCKVSIVTLTCISMELIIMGCKIFIKCLFHKLLH